MRWLFKPRKKERWTCATSLSHFDFDDRYPILYSQKLIQLVGEEERIQNIAALSGCDKTLFKKLYRPAIDNYCEACQLVPATVHHSYHTGIGGMINHTLDVIERVMKQRRGVVLPIHNPTLDDIVVQEHAWTYALFVAALLHNAKSLLTSTYLLMDGVTRWTPFGPPLCDTTFKEYQILYRPSEQRVSTITPIALIGILPSEGRQLLIQNDGIMTQLTEHLTGNYFEGGIISQMIIESDAHLLSRNYSGITESFQRRSQSYVAPCDLDHPNIGLYFFHWLKCSIVTGVIPVNNENGNVYITEKGVAFHYSKLIRLFLIKVLLIDKAQNDYLYNAAKRVESEFKKLDVLYRNNCRHLSFHLQLPNGESMARAWIIESQYIYPGGLMPEVIVSLESKAELTYTTRY